MTKRSSKKDRFRKKTSAQGEMRFRTVGIVLLGVLVLAGYIALVVRTNAQRVHLTSLREQLTQATTEKNALEIRIATLVASDPLVSSATADLIHRDAANIEYFQTFPEGLARK